jgi:hypothetical protein
VAALPRWAVRSALLASLGSHARLGHEQVRRGGGGGGYSARGGRRGRGAAATHGTAPGVLLPAACAQPLRAADADRYGQAGAGEEP